MTTTDWILLSSMVVMYAATIAVIETSAKRWEHVPLDVPPTTTTTTTTSDGETQARALRAGMVR